MLKTPSQEFGMIQNKTRENKKAVIRGGITASYSGLFS